MSRKFRVQYGHDLYSGNWWHIHERKQFGPFGWWWYLTSRRELTDAIRLAEVLVKSKTYYVPSEEGCQ